ncbi:MAG: HEAT repeat domain-containing protein [Planctomycetaceae bacterium]|jgi:hypothetical protein|nr:HEAT repeat domain-containing protein [Planctomycetaceae bacterium]
MSAFQGKTIKFLGKDPNPAAVEVLVKLLANPDNRLRTMAFDALFLRKDQTLCILLFKYFIKDEEFWAHNEILTAERLSRLADAAFRTDNAAVREEAARVILQYKLYETLPAVLMYLEGSDDELAVKAKAMTLQLSESFYADLLAAPESERRNFDRRREWFVQQLDGPIKRYSVNNCEELIKSLLILAKKDYETMVTLAADHRSVAGKKVIEELSTGEHGSYIRLLLSYIGDSGTPALIDEILVKRSDPLFVRKMLETVGPEPTFEFKTALKRFKEFAWFFPNKAELPSLVDGLEPFAVQLLSASDFPKDRQIKLHRFFLERKPAESRRAAAEAVRRLVGDDVNSMLLDFLNDSDPVTAATIFRILKARNCKEIDQHFDTLVNRPEPEIRQAIYDTMPDLHIESFASRFNQLTAESARIQGRYVRLIDPNTLKIISDDIVSPIPIRRLSACGVAAATGYARDFEKRIIEMAAGDDEGKVRIAAITALGSILTKDSIEEIKYLINDRSMDIRNAAAAALRDWMTAYQAQAK